jgi:hypothetical protein
MGAANNGMPFGDRLPALAAAEFVFLDVVGARYVRGEHCLDGPERVGDRVFDAEPKYAR